MFKEVLGKIKRIAHLKKKTLEEIHQTKISLVVSVALEETKSDSKFM